MRRRPDTLAVALATLALSAVALTAFATVQTTRRTLDVPATSALRA